MNQPNINHFLSWEILILLSVSRADCSNADKPGAIPQHNGLTQFGKVKWFYKYFSKFSLNYLWWEQDDLDRSIFKLFTISNQFLWWIELWDLWNSRVISTAFHSIFSPFLMVLDKRLWCQAGNYFRFCKKIWIRIRIVRVWSFISSHQCWPWQISLFLLLERKRDDQGWLMRDRNNSIVQVRLKHSVLNVELCKI